MTHDLHIGALDTVGRKPVVNPHLHQVVEDRISAGVYKVEMRRVLLTDEQELTGSSRHFQVLNSSDGIPPDGVAVMTL